MKKFGIKSVIAIDRGELVAANIDTRNQKIINSVRSRWTKFTLEEAIVEVKKELRLSKVRILIANELSYNLELLVPKNLSGINERKYIFDQIKNQIPDNLAETQWDYKELGVVKTKDKGEMKKIFVFAPVKSLMENLSESLAKSGLKVEAVEPQVVAQTRNRDPLIGLAMKEDISGDDSRVLNLEISPENRSLNTKNIRVHLNWKKLIYACFFVFLILDVVIFYFYRTSLNLNWQKQTVIDEQIAKQDEEIYSYSVNLQFLSEEDADLVENLLRENGFNNVEKVLIDTEGYETTIVRTKEGVGEATIGEVRNSLREFDTLFPSSNLDNELPYDIEIIIGRRNSN